jgi:hypothetical protein
MVGEIAGSRKEEFTTETQRAQRRSEEPEDEEGEGFLAALGMTVVESWETRRDGCGPSLCSGGQQLRARCGRFDFRRERK